MSKLKLISAKDCALVTRLVRKTDHVATGEIMRQAREEAGLSLRELARRLDVSPAYVSDLERGRRNWTQETMDKFKAVIFSKS